MRTLHVSTEHAETVYSKHVGCISRTIVAWVDRLQEEAGGL